MLSSSWVEEMSVGVEWMLLDGIDGGELWALNPKKWRLIAVCLRVWDD